MIRVYLSGGMNSNWRNGLNYLRDAPWVDVSFINPCEHRLISPRHYTAWDLKGVEICDIVFAYLASNNPSGGGLALEVGYAKALGKTIILVNEKQDEPKWNIVNECADYYTDNYDDGREILESVLRLYK